MIGKQLAAPTIMAEAGTTPKKKVKT